MISFQYLRRFFLTISLAFLLATSLAFGLGSTDSLAATMNRVEAQIKNMEGKTQEAIGNVTGDPKDQMRGKAKQVESQARNAAEDVKDKMKLTGRTKAVTKNIEGHVQETRGKVTGNRQDQVAGEAKQVESQARNTVEDLKDKVRDIFN